LAGTQPWKAAGTFFITPLDKSVEVIDNNLRSVKLSLPLKEEFSWKGNGFYPQNPYKELFDFSIDEGIQNWSSTYTELNGSMSYKGQTINNVVTVQQVDDSTNLPVTVTTPYASKRRSIERYAKGIGLVEQDFMLWEYQYDISRSTYYYKGFGVKRTMIDHN
ncbi:MAG TPA: hypothetical protein VFL47_15630, partial [Flavisolibacter sp.]|nr:hypothetical protein [Flavisolibacter sp.]